MPIVQGKYGILFANAHIFSEQISTTAILPNSGRAFPDQLWNVGVGLGGLHRFSNGWTAMANVSLGSASDRPFSADTTTIGLMASLRVPRGPRNAWIFSLMYANNSTLPIPIPGVAYAYSPSPRLFMMIGLPPSIVYRPTDNIVLEAMYMPLYNAHVRATYIRSPTLRFYGGFDWENQTYFLSDRPVQNDRFYYFDERLSVGRNNSRQALGRGLLGRLSVQPLFLSSHELYGRPDRPRRHRRGPLRGDVSQRAVLSPLDWHPPRAPQQSIAGPCLDPTFRTRRAAGGSLVAWGNVGLPSAARPGDPHRSTRVGSQHTDSWSQSRSRSRLGAGR